MDKFVYLDLDIHGSQDKKDNNADYWYNDTNYDNKGNIKTDAMTDRNSHTKVGHGIGTEKINLICDSNGKQLSAWEVIEALAKQYKKENPSATHLPVDEEDYIDKEGNKQHYMAYDYVSDFLELDEREKEQSETKVDKNWSLEQLLKQKEEEYKDKLRSINPGAIHNALEILDYRKKSRGKSVSEERLGSETQKIFKLMKQYEKDIKQIFIENKELLTHISAVSPKEMVGGKITKSKDIANNYETEYGNWVFASSSPIDGRNPYIARKPEDGMMLIANNTYIYGGNNMEVKADENGKRHVFLKRPNFVYKINPKRFLPVTTLKKDNKGEPYFEFSEEWISDQDVDINDSEQVENVETISEITDILQNYQVLCDINKQGIARRVYSSNSIEQTIKILYSEMKNNNLRYINGEARINVSPIFEKVKEQAEIFEEGVKNIAGEEKSRDVIGTTKEIKNNVQEFQERNNPQHSQETPSKSTEEETPRWR